MYVEFAKAIVGNHAQPPVSEGQGSSPAGVPRAGARGSRAPGVERAELLGKPGEARVAAQKARVSFVEAGEDSFALALADYFEGSAATFAGDSPAAWKLLRSAHVRIPALRPGELAGPGRGGHRNLALELVEERRPPSVSSTRLFGISIRSATKSPTPRPSSTAAMPSSGWSRFDAAKATYAKALMMARRLNMKVNLLTIRYGLASIDLQKGNLSARSERLRENFGRCAKGSRSASSRRDLRIAECLGRMGRTQRCRSASNRLRMSADAASVESDPAFRELFASVDDRSVSYELLAHIARFAEARDRGVRTAYKPFRLVANGS